MEEPTGGTQETGQATGGEAQSIEYFQSEKDKAQNLADERGTEIEELKTKLNSIQNPVAPEEGKPKDFDPYDAFNNPESASFKWRVKEMAELASNAAREAVSTVQADMVEQKFEADLRRRGYNDEQVQDCLDFAKNPQKRLGGNPTDAVIKLYEATLPTETPQEPSVRETQKHPDNVGIMQGKAPVQTDPSKDMFERVKNAGGKKAF